MSFGGESWRCGGVLLNRGCSGGRWRSGGHGRSCKGGLGRLRRLLIATANYYYASPSALSGATKVSTFTN